MKDLEREALRIAREIEGEDTHDLHLAEVLFVGFLMKQYLLYLLLNYFSAVPFLFLFGVSNMCYYDRKEDYNCMISLKLMRKPDFRQSLELLMTVDMMIARIYCWIHAMMKHLEVAMILLLGSHLLISLARSLMMRLKY